MRSGLVGIIVCAARLATAAPLAHLEQDVDGDGKPDRISVEPSGDLVIDGTSHATLALRSAPTRATIAAADVRGVPTLVVVVASSSGEETIVFERRGSWQELVRGPTGPVGTDSEYAIAIGAATNGIYRYQTRPGIRRCDGKPTYLFAEGWKDKKFRRLSKLPTEVPDTAPVIAAHLDAAAPPASLLYQARVASHEPGATDAGALAIPTELDDGKPTTFWREDFTKGAGEGQFFTFEPRFGAARATQLRIVPGNPTSPQTVRAFNRPKRLAIVGATGAWHVDLPDAMLDGLGAAYVADLPTPIDGCVTVVLESTYGPDDGQTAIAELEVFADGERNGGGEAALAHVVAEGKDGVKIATQGLARRGAAAAAAIEAELAKAKLFDVRQRLLRALIELKDPSAGPPLARAIIDGSLHDRDLDDAVAALGALGMAQELHDLVAMRELPLEARVAAARSLAGTDKAIDLAGTGPREVRRAVIEAMSSIKVPALVAATQAATTPQATGDLWRAVTRRAHAVETERAQALAALLAALPTATDYERRYRIVDGLATLGDAATLRTLDALLRGLPQDASRAAYEQIIARAIAKSPRAEALDMLAWLVREPDPGVRYAALSALGTAEGGSAGPWHDAVGADGIDRAIQSTLLGDTWPEVRRRAAQMLGTRCMRPGPAHSLVESISRDPDVNVRSDALGALVDCRAAGTAELLGTVWDNPKLPMELRARAVDLSVSLGDRAVAAKLVAKFTQWRGAALESAEALALAQNAAYAIGRLNPPGTGDALQDALGDAAFPEIVAAAATALGLMGPACPASAKSRLRTLAHSDEQQIQVAAAHAAAICGK
jgi:hypothetical protein